MKILHTSDWHLGKNLYNKKERTEEHQAFFKWLIQTIQEQSIDLLLVPGDIFDTSTPSLMAQKLYYQFLVEVIQTCCKHVVIVGGNHDSPSFLNAPKEILAFLNVQVLGHATENIADEILVIKNINDEAELIICAVPFLRSKDISKFVEGETVRDQSKRINEGIRKHYEQVAKLAEKKRNELNKNIPIIATGHLSVSGGTKTDDDGERGMYVGNIEAISHTIFPKTFDYVALGHYHVPSIIQEHIRYCGSPFPMGFGELGHHKCVFILETQPSDNKLKIEKIEIPTFQTLEIIKGDLNEISKRIFELKSLDKSVWIEAVYTGNEPFTNFPLWIDDLTNNSKIEVLKRRYLSSVHQFNPLENEELELAELHVYDVFQKLLGTKNYSEEQKEKLTALYSEILEEIQTNQ